MSKNVFNRKEIKYIITQQQKQELIDYMKGFMQKDKYSDNHVISVYVDTPNNALIRRSMEKPVYKEKMRIRSYGVASENSDVFMEIKKKYKGIVYKRRVEMSYGDVSEFINEKNTDKSGQIINEMKYFMRMYQDLEKSMYLSYYREAYQGIEDSTLRVTFDSEVTARTSDVELTSDIYGESILDLNLVVLEIKTLFGFPNWLNEFLSKNKIYKTSFSKYATAYKNLVLNGGNAVC